MVAASLVGRQDLHLCPDSQQHRAVMLFPVGPFRWVGQRRGGRERRERVRESKVGSKVTRVAETDYFSPHGFLVSAQHSGGSAGSSMSAECPEQEYH